MPPPAKSYRSPVAVGIIDPFKVIDIEQDARKEEIVSNGSVELFLHPGAEVAVIESVGQEIVHGQPLQLISLFNQGLIMVRISNGAAGQSSDPNRKLELLGVRRRGSRFSKSGFRGPSPHGSRGEQGSTGRRSAATPPDAASS